MAVFISYHSSKRAVVEHMANYFARHDISTWYAPRDVPPGSSWDEAISHAIRESTALVLLFCASADSSVHVKREIHLADKAKIPIYWVRLEKVQPERLGYYLAPTQWVDWLDQRDSTLDALVGDLKRPSAEGRALEPKRGATPHENETVSPWPATTIAFDNDRLAAEAAAHVYFRIAQDSPDRSLVLPTGRTATQLFRAMHRTAQQYAPDPFGEARIITDTETFGVFERHHTSRTRHVLETLIEPLTERGLGPRPEQLHLLSGQITDRDPLVQAQRVIRVWPPAVHAISISPAGEVLGYEVGMYTDPEHIVGDGCRIVELTEHGRRYIDPNQPSRSVLTIGLAAALECPGLMVLALDMSKARILHQMTHHPETAGVPATLLRRNTTAAIVTTRSIAEAAAIRDFRTPTSAEEGSEWILGSFN
ncbi:TIR domain-containing protein [Nocardia cyriacigeorgica]|uniref:TIR domain-containing protein n=1 Tax=Nocardia cyriacigeorgica TaxID=135487 RepID=UPI0013D2B650|nr:TIR domain-containing protein [Nocardia cyriacigeorgica]NEW25103.1 TIR domain-containing protein [Nocardia cyriacigeorgica]